MSVVRDVPGPVLETRGTLDLITVENGTVSIAGWTAALDGSRIDELRVCWGGRLLPQLQLEMHLPSADVAPVYPDMPGAAACRFMLRVPALGPPSDVLLSVLPRAGDRSGRRLYRFLDPQLPLPPQEHIASIGGEFILVALEMLDYFIERAGLRPEDRVLDVGCGVGRIAYPLAYYLNERGSFDGFDVMRPLIDWATEHLASRRPNFRFRHVDLHNGMYNPRGTLRADTFAFPYPDASFDFVALTSVFTHIERREVRHYLNEIARVLAPGGRVAATAFLIDAEARDLIRQRRSTQPLVHRYKGGYVADPRAPEGAMGYDEKDMRGWVEESGLRVSAWYRGSWCGRAGGLSYQDLLVLEGSAAGRRKPDGGVAGRFSRIWRG
jgi:ubiquinone/menaquinone biosynthesis C-methylase UbiE